MHAIYKNQKKLGCEIPDMGAEVPVGHHHLIVEVSLNGQQFTSDGTKFLYNSVDPNLTEEELKKMDELEEKNQKKGPQKKK
jgi:outer membrane usher protein FimD/PapC